MTLDAIYAREGNRLAETAVLAFIAYRAQGGVIPLSVPEIERGTGAHELTIRRVLKDLTASGVLKVEGQRKIDGIRKRLFRVDEAALLALDQGNPQ